MPAETIQMIGIESVKVVIEIGFSWMKFECYYEYRKISDRKNLFTRPGGRWWELAEHMDIQQGDKVYFEGAHDNPYKFHVEQARQSHQNRRVVLNLDIGHCV